ncbi:MAG: DUF4126 domain-containing protein [Cyanobacteria bacterium P01_D01_bin.105]
MNTLISICIGIGLSTATGFRILVPFACLSAAAVYGNIALPTELAWLNAYPVLIGLILGTLLEIAAYYVPWVNDALDTVELPAAIISGTYLTGAFAADLPTLMQWSLALVAGGGIAGAINSMTGMTRLATNTATGGTATPVTSSLEWMSALMLAMLSLTLPLLALTLIIILLVFASRRRPRKRS